MTVRSLHAFRIVAVRYFHLKNVNDSILNCRCKKNKKSNSVAVKIKEEIRHKFYQRREIVLFRLARSNIQNVLNRTKENFKYAN